MAVLAGFEMRTGTEQPQSHGIVIDELMPDDVLTYTGNILGAPSLGGGGGGGDDGGVGYAVGG